MLAELPDCFNFDIASTDLPSSLISLKYTNAINQQHSPIGPDTVGKTVGTLTRSHKYTDRDHAGLADGTAAAEEHLPRFFAKAGHTDSDPNKIKKNGGGKGNWGHEGDEFDDTGYHLANPRRRSNSSTHVAKDFKTKFETIDPEPVFEEEIHGPIGAELDKQSTTSSSKSVDEEDGHKKL